MENILKIIYDKTIKDNLLNLNDIKKFLELLIVEKSLNNYVLDIDIQPIRSNILASYSNYDKNITIYNEMVAIMVKNIEKNILTTNDFEKFLYKNFSILQMLLHEIEHANQQKIAYNENSLEAFIIRLSYLIDDSYEGELYECCPEERLAEIKSFEEVLTLLNYLNLESNLLAEILATEKLQRLLRGYHYKNFFVECPIIKYFIMGERKDLLNAFDWYNNLFYNSLNNAQNRYNLEERCKYGFPISNYEYKSSMKKMILSLSKNFDSRINIDLQK